MPYENTALKWAWRHHYHQSNLDPTLHLARLKTSSFSKLTLLLSFSTCLFHVSVVRPRFLLPFTSNSNTFLKTCPSSLLNTCPYHLTPFAFAIWTTVFPSIPTSPLGLLSSFSPSVLHHNWRKTKNWFFLLTAASELLYGSLSIEGHSMLSSVCYFQKK